ncbi:hypothetical protein Fmac_032437 [Flemingia macrophylla]|uniref:Uncharacterized protein n=1 Tax=Flemingia macrophylla TaxID=520843 RepID=A0ABD1L4X8_9FABA
MEDVEDKPSSESEASSTSTELMPQAETPEGNTEMVNPSNSQSSMEAPTNLLRNNSGVESGTHLPETKFSGLEESLNASDGQIVEQDEYLHTDNPSSTHKATIHDTEQSHHLASTSKPGPLEEYIFNRQQDGVSTATAGSDVDNPMNLSTSSFETKELQTNPIELITDPPQTKVVDVHVPKDNSASTPNVTVHVTEQSKQGDRSADSEPEALEDISNRQQGGGSTASAGNNVDNQMEVSTSSSEEKELQNEHKKLMNNPSQTMDIDASERAVRSPSGTACNDDDNQIKHLASSSEKIDQQNDQNELMIDASQTRDTDASEQGVSSAAANDDDNQIEFLAPSSEKMDLQSDHEELKIELPQTEINNVSMKTVDSPSVSDDNRIKLLASSFENVGLQNDEKELKTDISRSINDVAAGAADSPTAKQIAEKRGLIDTAAPFESVKEAVSKFGGIVDWKAHRIQTVERRKHVEHELEKAQQEIPVYQQKSQAAEQAKMQVLQELDSTKRLIEELKLNLERAQTEERQARQDSELAKLRVEEMEQGIADDSSIAAKAQLEVAKARYSSAIIELTSVKEELDGLRVEYASLVDEKDEAVKKAEEAVASSKQVEKTVEDLTIELIATKEALESAHAAHMEAEEHRIGTVMARDQDSLNWDKELKQAEEELQRLSQKILSAKDLKSKLNTASALLLDLKAELNVYMESSKSKHEGDEGELVESEKKTHSEIQEAVASARKELEEVRLNIEKATTEVNYLKVAAASLKSQLENEKSSLASIRQREGMASVTVASLESDLDNTTSEMVLVQMKEKESRERIAELPKKLQQAVEEANQANLVAQAAREELRRVKEEAEQAEACASTMQSKLLAAQKEIEAARASERLAMAATKALQESESSKNNNEVVDSSSWVMLSVEEYYNLSKQAHEAEDQANMRIAAANSEIKKAKESELKTLEKLNDVTREMALRRESLKIAMDKAEKARQGKLGAEQELRKWRAEHEQRRKAGGLGQEVNQSTTPKVSIERHKEANNFDQAHSASMHYLSSSKSYSNSGTVSSPERRKKKKKSFFPWVLMFFGKKRSHSTH